LVYFFQDSRTYFRI